ncbi:MAG: SDR family oxidoreductase [Magnetospirillum sp. WYHS-4]
MVEAVLIAGGSGGIGSAVARRLAAAGLKPLVGYGRNRAAAEALGWAIPLDMSDPAAIDAAVEEAAKEPLLGLVLAASPPPVLAPFGQIAADDMEHQWRINVVGAQRLLAGIVKRCFRPRKKGIAVAVLTAAMGDGKMAAMPNLGAYVIAKYGLQGVMAAAAAEYPWLETHLVRPGFTETAMLDAFDPRFLDLLRAKKSFAAPETVAEDICAPFMADIP